MFTLCLVLLMSPIRWAAYYSDVPPAGGFRDFQMLILDSVYHPPLDELSRGRTLLGYISVGEIEQTRSPFKPAKAKGVLAGENENWKGSFFVDVRSALDQGFDGVFLDTIDDAEYLEDKDAAVFRGMKDAMVRLILEIRREFPAIPIAVNRGYAIVPKIGPSVDFILGESVFSDYDFASKSYRRVPQKDYAEQVNVLKAARQRNPKLNVLTLDYWDPKDAAGISRIYREQRTNGFSPYVSTVELDRILREPIP